VVAEGTPAELKARVGASRIEVVVPEGRDLAAAARSLRSTLVPTPDVDLATRTISVPVQRDASTFTRLGESLEAAGLGPDSVTVRRPDLDDVFLDLTGLDAQGASR
jgi:ABC-2 type transport system ATP-binding protein